MLRSHHLIILSSSIGDLLGRNSPPQAATGRHRLPDTLATVRHRLPQAATGCPTLWPRIQQNSLNRCSRLHRNPKWLSWVPRLNQSSPNAPTCLQGPAQVTPQVTQGIQHASQIGAKCATRRAQRRSSKHPSIQAGGPRGRRQRR